MKKTYLTLLLSVLLLSSCTITQEFHFNKDFSGTAKLSVDMGMFIGMMKSMDTSSAQGSVADSLKYAFGESKIKLDSIGAINVKYNWDDSTNVMYLSYEFSDINMLNSSLNATNETNKELTKEVSTEPHVFFKKNGKTLIYDGPKTKSADKSSKEMTSMKDYYKYNLIFTFDRKIKSAENPNIIHENGTKKVELKGSMFDILSQKYDSKITFKLK
ncbi:MAG: hypothetical protein JXR51_00440 [Bacteroidales bacterium]|nr:hypothetical protein [Bacteroidales bacterium]MBN2755608.1 hypothetical protein [Bacteroidales bacterium]